MRRTLLSAGVVLVTFGLMLVAITLYSAAIVSASLASEIELVGAFIMLLGIASIVLASVQRSMPKVQPSSQPSVESPIIRNLQPRPASWKLVAVSIVVIVIVAASIGGVLVYLKNNPQNQVSNGGTSQLSTGQPPVWYTFDNVFNANCNPGNCFAGTYSTASGCQYTTSGLLTCYYQGTPYYGYVGLGASTQYCNIQPSGVIPSVNGTLVPYLGCVLSRAPLTQLFSDLYTLSGSGSSISMWESISNQVTVFPTANFQSYSCSYQGGGTLTCNYLGMTYSGGTSNACNLGTPIQVNGEPVPADACLLQRG